MKGDVPNWALKLQAAAPHVVTHERSYFVPMIGSKQTKSIVIAGRRYKSIIDVKKRLHVCSKTVMNWLNSGKAVRE